MADESPSASAPSLSDHYDTEEQPFLDTQAFEPNKRGRSLPWTVFQLALFLSLITISFFGLATICLRFRAEVSAETQLVEKPSHGGSPVRPDINKDEIPSKPQLRNGSEYILTPSWNVSAPPTTREYNWTILEGMLNPDGIYRPMILINNKFPGPLLECNEDDILVIHVDNRATNATSIHFHGLFQNGTNDMDGAVGVTQCAIAPGSSFTYRFNIRGQSGTYWYHAHHSAQASDGLLGPMVIHPRVEQDSMDQYESDRVIMVQDHYHNLTSELLMDYLKPDQENNEPVPDNALINGHGIRKCTDFPGWPCDESNVSTPTFDLTSGSRHKFRIINVGAFAEFQIQFDEHAFYVTEVDGTEVHPEPFHRLNILPAQRYSIVLETNVTTAENFWMRARMVTHCFTMDNKYLQPETRGIIRYINSEATPSESAPTSKDWSEAIEVLCRDLDTRILRPIEALSPPPADDFLVLRANFEIGDWRLARGFFNDSTWHMNGTHPSLHRFLDADENVTSLDKPLGVNDLAFDRKTEMVLQTTGIRTVDISINNFDDGAHPFHLHGHKFFVLLQGDSGYPPSAADLPGYLEKHGLLKNPLRRDTVTVQGYAWAIIRVILDNPGLWIFHCHNMWHAESGMVMQMLVRSEIVSKWEVREENREMCQREGITNGMRPEDSIWFGQFER